MSERLNAEFGLGDALRIERHNDLLSGLVKTRLCEAQFYMHGAHIVRFQPAGQRDLLFVSRDAVYDGGKAIRGGIPICFPWFGPHKTDASAPSHGLVRTRCWKIKTTKMIGEAVEVVLHTQVDDLDASFRMLFDDALHVELSVVNRAPEAVSYETALHSYFSVSDIRQVEVLGLEGVTFLDQLTGAQQSESHPIRFTAETDRIYRPSAHCVTLRDPGWEREILVEKSNSQSTVVWNPWIDKAARTADFGDDEWPLMCCIETANILPHGTTLGSGEAGSIGATHRVLSV